MDRKQRIAARNISAMKRRLESGDTSGRTLNDRLAGKGIPAADRESFLDWAVEYLWTSFKEERMNQRLIIENEIRGRGIRFPNGTVKKDYETRFSLPLDRISGISLEGAEELGLNLTVNESGESLLSGRPTKAGDFTLRLRYSTLEGEPISELAVPIAFNPNPRDLWKNIPTDLGIPYYKEDSESAYIRVEGSADNYPRKNMLAASQRGRSHAQEGRPRDDHFSLFHCDESDWYILSVADGAGSARYSRKGSEVACATVIDYCKSRLLDNPEFNQVIADFQADRDNEERRVRMTRHVIDIVLGAARKAHEAVNRLAEVNEREEVRPKDFATTLMFAICRKFEFGWFIASFWVGDGAIALYDAERKSIKLLGTPDEGEFSGQTRFLTMPEIFRDKDVVSKRMRISIVPDFTALFLMTDGISDPMFETERNLSDYSRWEAFYNRLREGFPEDGIGGVDLSSDNPASQEQLLSWLDFWSPGNHDDRTIALLY